MKLYHTPTSPYARIVRIVILEKGLADRVEVIQAQTRKDDSPYYTLNPSGRVPHLVRDDGPAFEDSALICDWLDQIDGKPMFTLPAGEAGWEARRLEALGRSFLDGLAVWGRELGRPENERGATTLRHEAGRAARMADLWEREITHPWMNGPLNMAQIVLACAFGFAYRAPEFRWREGHPRLAAWFDRFSERSSFKATSPV